MIAAMLGGWEIILILTVMAVMVISVLAVVLLVVWLTRRNRPDPPPTLKAGNPARCPRCGSPLPPDSPEGLCPRCVLGVGLETQTEAGPLPGPHGTQVPKPPPPQPAAIAKLFPQLEILECLGRGGMGAVYKARQPKLDRFVALKILTPERQGDAQFRERFEREARTLARLSHPNIVAVYDFGETNGYCYLLMEYVDGLTLRQLIQSRKLMPEEALSIVPKVCEALEFAHGKGIVHRDIKPENILLDRAGNVKIADFGIAKILQPGAQDFLLTGAKDVVGTPHYMAPEQVEHPTKVDHRADIFSLGVVFYEMLTGELPLGKFALPSRKVQVDVRLDEVVLHALEKEPERRYQHASEVKTDVERISGTTTSAPESPRWVVVVRWVARVSGTVLLLIFATFMISEGLPPIALQPGGVQLNFVALGLMLLGFILGWKRDGAAALLIASGWTVWHISEGRFAWNLFQAPLALAGLYALCWSAANRRRVCVIAGASLVLLVLLGLGRLLVPANIFVRGILVDAQTGEPVVHGELRLASRASRSLTKGDSPNARSASDGRFSLYVGWYDQAQTVIVTAPGYTTLTTNLGPREIGRRSLDRRWSLQPISASGPAVPPVVVRTFPVSGITDVDPAVTELRVTFSKPMRDGCWSWVDLGDGSFPTMAGEPHYLDDHQTCVLPVKLEPGHVYATWINVDNFQNFQDQAGRPAVPYLLIFETRK